MIHTTTQPTTPGHTHPAGKAYELLTALSMTVGRRRAAQTIAELAQLTPDDRVIDIGCGPGTAARIGARRCAHVTGVDPTPAMLRLGRWLTALHHVPNVTFVTGAAESLPLPDASATVVWALSSLHHWADRAAGLGEAARVLAPGGRILLAERLVEPGAPGPAAHGLSRDQADQLAVDLTAGGFTDVRYDIREAGRRTLVVLRGSQPSPR